MWGIKRIEYVQCVLTTGPTQPPPDGFNGAAAGIMGSVLLKYTAESM